MGRRVRPERLPSPARTLESADSALAMDISDFDYELPEELIAQHPLPDRDQSRLLWRNAGDGAFREGFFRDLVDRLHPGDLLVANDTRVVPARLEARKPSGGRVEVMLERILSSGRFLAQLQSNRPVAPGQELSVADRTLIVEGREGRFHVLRIGREVNADGLFRDHGAVPLPPYIRRKPVREDGPRYQTVYAAVPGAVAAPTAGLHFTPELLRELGERGIGWTTVTLHVGAGTFLPVQDDDLETHRMHAEWIDVSEETCERVRQAGKVGGRVVAVGTTAVRALETAALGGEPRPIAGDTDLFIRPGFRFRVVDALVTNFHLPKSTLLVLVAAFAGYHPVMEMYRYAVANRFRFFSYGDAMLLERTETAR